MFYFAWIDGPEVAFNAAVHATRDENGLGRLDEDIFEHALEHGEGQFASLTLLIANPGVGLLSEGREQWAFFAEDIGEAIVCRGKFQLIGVPDGLQHEEITIKLIAQPVDFEEQKAALAATLKGDPLLYDPVFIDRAALDDPDSALLARTADWHIDPVTHVVTISDRIAGEGEPIVFSADDVFYDARDLRLTQMPARRIEVTAEIRWTQHAVGTIDITNNLINAFRLAGSEQPFMISSYTAGGLVGDWPLPETNIGGGWRFVDTNVEDGGGRWVSEVIALDTQLTAWAPDTFGTTITAGVSVAVDIGLGIMRPTLVVGYDARRSYVERVRFTLEADVQMTAPAPGDAEVMRLSLSSNDVSEPIYPDGTDGAAVPIVDVRRRSYMLTDSGKISAQYLVARARASLLDRARCVSIPFEVVYDRLVDVTLRKSATIADPALPGGAAQGKVVAWRESGNGDTGDFTFGVQIACCAGNGGSVSASDGAGVYAADGYMADGYQARTGRTILVAGDVTLADYAETAISDDGIDFLAMGSQQAIQSLTVTNGPAAQRSALKTHYADVAAATEALQAVATQVCLELRPLTGGPFETDFDLICSPLQVPQGIDLAAAA